MKTPETCNLIITVNNVSTNAIALAVPKLSHDMLLSRQNLTKPNIISANFLNQIKNVPSFHTNNEFNELTSKPTTEFEDIISDTLSPNPIIIPDITMNIHLNKYAKLFQITTARQIPLRLQTPAETVIQELIDKKAIRKVENPTPWCSPGLFVPQPDEKRVRLVTDYTKLNKYTQRPIYPFPSSRDIIQSIPSSATILAKLDAAHGYFQLAPDEELSQLTTFLLPSGHYQYLRAPMRLPANPDEWRRHSDTVIKGMKSARKIVNDILVWCSSLTEPTCNLKKRYYQTAEKPKSPFPKRNSSLATHSLLQAM